MTNLGLLPCRQLLKDNADGKLGIKITDPRVCKDDRHLCTLCHKIFACEEMHRMMDLDDVKECWCYNCLDKYNFKN